MRLFAHHHPGAHQHHWGVIAWVLPFVAIWALAATALAAVDFFTACSGLCAVYAGWETYSVLFVAAAISAVVALAEVVLFK